MIIGFDFDKVFINYPPFVPYFLIDFLYKGTSVFRKNVSEKSMLHYRIPGKLEQRVRVISHHPSLRAPIKTNLEALKEISASKRTKTYLVSSRFSFLRKRTDAILKKYSLNTLFDGIYFNYNNEQPHEFKEKTIKKLRIDTYIDDDVQLALYLSKRIPSLRIFWVSDGRSKIEKMPKNIITIRSLSELNNYLDIK